ncbi:MAG: glycosyltransferase family 9 protein [Porticoccaceae bacterium]
MLTPRDSVMIWMPSKHMGNLLVSLRAVEALENAVGDRTCALVIDETYRDLMDATALRSPVIYFPRKKIDNAGVRAKLGKVLAFIKETRKLKPSVAIAVEGDKVSQKFTPFSGCRLSIGPDNRYCKFYDVRLALDHGQRHVFHDYEAVARQLTGTPLAPGYIHLEPTDKARARLDQILGSNLPFPGRPYAIIHPCATKDYKQWPMDDFAALADAVSASAVNVVITGAGSFDGETIAGLRTRVKHPVISLHNQLSIGELIALMKSALFFIGNDTGPTHLAAACGTPTFALFGPTDEYLWGPLGDNATILRSRVACEPECLRRNCAVGYRCMQTLDISDVFNRIRALL